MGSGVESDGVVEEVEEEKAGFDFSSAEQLIDSDEDELKGKARGEPLEGDVQTAAELAKMQSRSLVGLMDMSFKFGGNDGYSDDVYKDGEKYLSPAIVRLNFRIPAFEVINAVGWLGLRLVQSFKEIKINRAKKDAKQKHEQAEQ